MWDWRNYLSFQGRLNRKPYWLMNLVLLGAALLAFIIVSMLAALLPLFWVLGVPLFGVYAWVAMSIAARRLHDRRKSAWWLLIYQGVPMLVGGVQTVMELSSGGRGATGPANLLGLINFGLAMWVLADLGFMKGRPGPNRFGDDPLGPEVQEVFA